MHLKMDGYPDSLCYQNTALSCVSCSNTFLIKTKVGCLKRDRDGCMPEHVYWYRLMTCLECSKMLKSFSVFCTMVASTNAITKSSAYKRVCDYLHVTPRIYSIKDLHMVYPISAIVDSISSEARIEQLHADRTISENVHGFRDI
jgi:hypothetical protein